MSNHKKYYLKNNKYSEFLENKDPNSFVKYVEFVSKYLKKGGLFLDVGCGTGSALSQIKKNNIKVVGIDVSNPSIKKCQKKGLDCILYDGKEIPFKDNYFDMVGSFNVLEHTDNPILFLNEQVRVLKKKGYIIVSCPNFLSTTNSYHWHTSGLIRKTKNLIIIFRKFLIPNSKFEKMNVIIRKDFHVDDDACNMTNPLDIIKWANTKKLDLAYWSSQELYANGIKKLLDKGFLRYFLGASFMVFYKRKL